MPEPPREDFMQRSDLQMANVSGFTSCPNRWVSAPAFTAAAQGLPLRVSPVVT